MHGGRRADSDRLWRVQFQQLRSFLAVADLRHGIDSALRTLGRRGAPTVSLVVAGLLCVGFLSVPYSVLFGLGR